MLRITQSETANGALIYFKEELQPGQYYSQGGQSQGVWGGKTAELLGLSGVVDIEQFERCLKGYDPLTGRQLVSRIDKDRRPGCDWTFSVPKSVSIMRELGSVEEREMVKGIFDRSVNETMQEMESEMKARVREGGANYDRVTGNMVWARFDHSVTRPVDGLPDPHLHAHVYVLNLTRDGGKWKAGQLGDLCADAPYWEAVFEQRVARGLQEAGYGIRRTEKGWEIAGISERLVEMFSRRTAQIEEEAIKEAKKLEIRTGALMRETGKSFEQCYAKAKGELGAKTRKDKKDSVPYEVARKMWRAQLNTEDQEGIGSARGRGNEELRDLNQSVRHAVEDGFSRESVMRTRMLIAKILKAGTGAEIDRHVVEERLMRFGFVHNKIEGRDYITTSVVLGEEKEVVDWVRKGKGKSEALGGNREWKIQREWMNEEKRQAVQAVLGSRDKVIGIRGAAGTGKSSMLQEVSEAIRACTGRAVVAIAPTAEAAKGLRNEGFEGATTVSAWLVDVAKQAEIRGGVLLIDETGLTSMRDMRRVMRIAEEQRARVIMVGDRNQHRAVERGDTLRILEKHAKLKSVELKEIQRQEIEEYKEAAYLLAEGKGEAAFKKLDEIGFVSEIIDDEERYAKMLESYAGLKGLKHEEGACHTVLMIAPTHEEIGQMTERTRSLLQERGIVDEKSATVTRLAIIDLSKAQKRDHLQYRAGLVVECHQQIPGSKRSEQLTVVGANEQMVMARDNRGGMRRLQLTDSDKWSVYQPEAIELSIGEQIRITKNQMIETEQANSSGQAVRRKVCNGDLLSVEKIEKDKIYVKERGRRLGYIKASKGVHLNYGYVITSNTAQSKTVDWILASAPIRSLSMVSKEAFLVTCSRGRYGCQVYTDSKTALREATQITDYRMSAYDMMEGDLGERAETLKKRRQDREEEIRTKRAKLRMSPSETMDLKQPIGQLRVEAIQLTPGTKRASGASVQRGFEIAMAHHKRQVKLCNGKYRDEAEYMKRRKAWAMNQQRQVVVS
jgi:conjugative relaxase-like TrwC/TraI family protein